MLQTLAASKKRQVPHFIKNDFYPFTHEWSAYTPLSPLVFFIVATRQTNIEFMISSVSKGLPKKVKKL